jgi:hypothetical protein
MYARVVRFTDVSPERVAEINERVESEGGPPPDVPAKSLTVVVDESQSTAVVVLFFDSEEDMRKGDEALNQMDAGETPGTRASVDQGEVKVQRDT